MKKNNKFLFIIVSIFVLIACITTFVSFSSNVDVQEVVVKSITPVYDENSTIDVDGDSIIFNDKNQVVEYKVVIENTQNYDVRVDEFFLSSPSEEFLEYTIKNIENDEIIKANSIKEFILSLETTGIKGWGRNFKDELTANISFDRVTKNEEVEPPQKEENKDEVEPPKEDIKQPVKPAENIQDIINKTEKIEVNKITKNTIEFKDEVKVEKGDKIAVWLYSDPIFLGYFDVVEINGIKQIVGLEEALKEADIESGEHHIVLTTEESETIGYVEVYVDDKQQVSEDKPTTEEDSKIENPYTNTGLIILYTTVAGVAVIGIIVLRNKKVNKYFILAVLLSSSLTFVKAEESIELSISLDVSFKSQNVMKPSELEYDPFDDETWDEKKMGVDYWSFASQIKEFHIQNEITEIVKYTYVFDVTEANNSRVKAYLIDRDEGNACHSLQWDSAPCYDLYLVADGIIYPNENASYYFAGMNSINKISNLEGIDTSNVTNMKGMFAGFGFRAQVHQLSLNHFNTSNVNDMSYMFQGMCAYCENFTLDIRELDTSNVTDMSYMFNGTAIVSSDFYLDVSNFDTSKVTNMRDMFNETAVYSSDFYLDVSNFDTSDVTNMRDMFAYAGENSPNFTLDVSNFDTSKVTNMSGMFKYAGYNNPNFTLDISNFDTSNVTDMSWMFESTGYNSEIFTLDMSNFDTSNVTDMSGMFAYAGYNSENLVIDASNFDTSNVTNMDSMFDSTGYNSRNLTLDVSNFDTSKVTNMWCMFAYAGYNSENLVIDVSNFDTSNVVNMNSMFAYAGYNSENLVIDVSNFDTSNVVNMNYMFRNMGYNSTKLNTSITIKNPNLSSIWYIFDNVATKEGSQIKVNYTSETEELVNQMIENKSSNSNVVKGNLIVDVDNLSIGDEIHISGEKFNVISKNEDTVTMLAQYNLGTDYKQTTKTNYVNFSNNYGWENTPGPKEIDIQQRDGDAKDYVNNYIKYLKDETGDNSIQGNLISLQELKDLGCTISDDYSNNSGYCYGSNHYSWLIRNSNYYWWTRSANSTDPKRVYSIGDDDIIEPYEYNDACGTIRPTITISKDTLRNLNKI